MKTANHPANEEDRLHKTEPSSWFSRKEAAQYAHVSTDTIDRWVSIGYIKRIKLNRAKNGRVLIDRKSIDAFYRQCGCTPPALSTTWASVPLWRPSSKAPQGITFFFFGEYGYIMILRLFNLRLLPEEIFCRDRMRGVHVCLFGIQKLALKLKNYRYWRQLFT